MSMLPVVLVIVGERVSGAYTIGGVASAGFSLAGAAIAPFAGRWIDRHGQRLIGRRLLVVFVAACLGLVWIAMSSQLVWALIPLSAMAGASAPNIGAFARARWATLVAREDFESAHALESINDEINHLVGPAAATGLATAVSSTAALLVPTIGSTVGTLGVTALPEHRRDSASGLPLSTRWVDSRRMWLLATMVGLGSTLAAVLVLIVAYTDVLGRPDGAALVLFLSSTASLTAALVVGRLRFRMHPRRRLMITLIIYSASIWPLALVQSYAAFAVAGFVAGAAIAPTFIQANTYVALTTTTDRSTEAFYWMSAGVALGLAIGSTVTGMIVDAAGADDGRIIIALFCLAPAVIAIVSELVQRRTSAVTDDDHAIR